MTTPSVLAKLLLVGLLMMAFRAAPTRFASALRASSSDDNVADRLTRIEDLVSKLLVGGSEYSRRLTSLEEDAGDVLPEGDINGTGGHRELQTKKRAAQEVGVGAVGQAGTGTAKKIKALTKATSKNKKLIKRNANVSNRGLSSYS